MPGTLVEIDAGYVHTCALDDGGAAWCWGDNAFLQLGNEAIGIAAPQRVEIAGVPAGPFDAISAGLRHTCAIDIAGRLWCWGNDALGQLGDGAPNASSAAPRQASTPGYTFTQVAVGDDFTCAIDAQQGSLHCWGANGSGQLGLGDTIVRDAPTRLSGAENLGWNYIAAGGQHACGARSIPANATASDVFCWGANNNGQLGTGNFQASAVPLKVLQVAGSGVGLGHGTIALGTWHTCVRSTYFFIPACWGSNTRGQLVDGTTTTRNTPMGSDFDPALQVAAGARHTCALSMDGTLACGGDAANGQAGNGAMGNALVPQFVFGLQVWTPDLFSDSFEDPD
jgi:alpha-tubulin suppressor-like RCC1 family protein